MDFNNSTNGNNNTGNNNNGYNMNHYPPNNGYNNRPNGSPNPYGYPYTPPVKLPGSGMALAAMVLGIISIVTACMMTFYFPFIFGSLAILFALLSKGSLTKMQTQAKTGIICGIIGLVLNCGIMVYSVNLALNNPELMIDTAIMYDDMIEQMYGVPSEEILGDSMEDVITDMYDILK